MRTNDVIHVESGQERGRRDSKNALKDKYLCSLQIIIVFSHGASRNMNQI